jgi:hypothetical protein
MNNDGDTTIKPGYEATRQLETHDMIRSVVLLAFPYIRKYLRLENTQGGLQSGMLLSSSETRGMFYDGLGSNIVA